MATFNWHLLDRIAWNSCVARFRPWHGDPVFTRVNSDEDDEGDEGGRWRDAPALIGGKVASWIDEADGIEDGQRNPRYVGMQNSESEKARNVADRDDEEEEEATSSDGAAEEAVGDRDGDEALSRDADAEEAAADRATDERSCGAENAGIAERDDEDPSSDAEQQAAAVTGAGRDDRNRKETRKKKGDCVWTMYLPSTSGKETLAVQNNNYGCEHYKRKSKFVVSHGVFDSARRVFICRDTLMINITTNSLKT